VLSRGFEVLLLVDGVMLQRSGPVVAAAAATATVGVAICR